MGKIIYFGYNKKDYLDSCIDGVFPYQGEYLDTVSINNLNFLFTKSKINNKVKIDVREIFIDMYLDGSYTIYGNENKSKECIVMENYFNKKDILNRINNGIPPLYILLELEKSFKKSNINIDLVNKFIMIVLIKKYVFENCQDILINNNNKSFIELANEANIKQEIVKYFNY